MVTRTRDPVNDLKAEVQRIRGKPAGIDMEPASAYEAITRQMVEGFRDELREIRGRINGLIFLLVGMMIGEVLLRLITAR
ncbi:hypothetical protein BH09CHL1_BH09CHL1_02250 [soil metagenome]